MTSRSGTEFRLSLEDEAVCPEERQRLGEAIRHIEPSGVALFFRQVRGATGHQADFRRVKLYPHQDIWSEPLSDPDEKIIPPRTDKVRYGLPFEAIAAGVDAAIELDLGGRRIFDPQLRMCRAEQVRAIEADDASRQERTKISSQQVSSQPEFAVDLEVPE